MRRPSEQESVSDELRRVGSWVLGAVLLPSSFAAAGETVLTVNGAAGDGLGFALAEIGDFDGDGRSDVLVGAPTAAGGLGQARVVSGATGVTLTTLTGIAGQLNFGSKLAGAGDVDADGVVDFVVSTPVGPSNPPIVRVFSGATGALLMQKTGTFASYDLGHSVAGLGDIDGDGHDDVAMGATHGHSPTAVSGTVEVFSGATGASLLLVDSGALAFSDDEFGYAIEALPDLNQDGAPDFAVGAPQGVYHDPQGFVRIFSGADGAVLHHVANDGLLSFGWSLGIVPDVDGDTLPELVVGAPSTGWSFLVSEGTGAVAIVSTGSGAKLATIYGSDPNESLGINVSSATDYAVDGAVRFAAIGSQVAGTVTCRVMTLDGSVTDEYTSPAPLGMGWSLVNVGDVDGDGSSELAYGLPKDATGGTNAGSIQFVSCDGFKQAYGESCGGASPPTLSMLGCPAPNAPLTVVLKNGPAGSSGVILFGTGPASTPIGFGCSLLVSLPLLPLQVPFTLNGLGSANIAATLPPSTPSFSLAIQAWVADASTSLGFSGTNGFRFGF